MKIEELKAERGRFYVTVSYGEAGQTRIDYKTYDVHKATEFPFTGVTPSKRSPSSGFPVTDPARKVLLLAASLNCQSRTDKVRLWAME